MAGLSGEFPAALEKWTFDSLPISYVQANVRHAMCLRESNLNYTIYASHGSTMIQKTQIMNSFLKTFQFNDAQVTRGGCSKSHLRHLTCR